MCNLEIFPADTPQEEFIWPKPSSGLLNPKISEDDLMTIKQTTDAVRLSALIVDTPTNEMNVDHFLEVNQYDITIFNFERKKLKSTQFQHVKDVGQEFNLKPTIIRGEELAERGFGGIYGVGKVSHKTKPLQNTHIIDPAMFSTIFLHWQ